MKKTRSIMLLILFPLWIGFSQAQTTEFVFHLSITDIPKPDSVAILGAIPPLSMDRPVLMKKTDKENEYTLTLSFADSMIGKPLTYRYRCANNSLDILRKIILEKKQHTVIEDNWAYLDGKAAKVKPGQPLRVRYANSPEEAAELKKPFVGITTDGKPLAGLFPIKKTGVSTLPIKNAVSAFLNSLSEEQKAKCMFPVNSDEWRRWHNVDIGFYARTGIGLEELTQRQVDLVWAFLSECLSAQGIENSKTIMEMEQQLAIFNNDFKKYGRNKYWLTFMGTPSDTEPWGWQLDGHHLIINYFILGDQVVMTPTFMGSEPTFIDSGEHKGLRSFEKEEEKGLAFYRSLNEAQKAKATIWHAKDMNFNRTEGFRDNEILPVIGLPAVEMTKKQRKALLNLIKVYVGNMKEGQARVKMEEVSHHIKETNFTWVQGPDINGPFYYRIHSPVILIEFDHQTPIGYWDKSKPRPGPSKSHTHTIVRTPNGNDYGKDLLEEHLEKHHHGGKD